MEWKKNLLHLMLVDVDKDTLKTNNVWLVFLTETDADQHTIAE